MGLIFFAGWLFQAILLAVRDCGGTIPVSCALACLH